MENKIDWISLLLYFVILLFGWLNIYAACYDESHAAVFDFSTKHGKQLIWIGISLLIAALAAQGESYVLNAESIDRGYESVEERLGELGADIRRE